MAWHVTAVTCAVPSDITASVLSVLLGDMASGWFSRAVSLSVVGFRIVGSYEFSRRMN